MQTAAEKLDSAGVDWVCSQLEDGRSQRDIARELQVSVGSLNAWLHADHERSVRASASMDAGADRYEHDALQVIERTRDEVRNETNLGPAQINALVQLAREEVQSCWRMASARSRRWSASRHGDTFNIDARKQALTAITIQTVKAGGGVRAGRGVANEQMGVLSSTDTTVEAIENAAPQKLELPELKVIRSDQWRSIGNIPDLDDL